MQSLVSPKPNLEYNMSKIPLNQEQITTIDSASTKSNMLITLTDDYIALGIEEKMQYGKTRFLLRFKDYMVLNKRTTKKEVNVTSILFSNCE
jgi:hypothetical protein